MAFVNATPFQSSLSKTQSLRPELSTSPLRSTSNKASKNTTCMGYGDYSYLTDYTKGHVNQYYVDKFRNIFDFAKGPPADEQDGLVGRTSKGAVKVPAEGIPQLDSSYTSLIPIVEDVIPDPRIDESEGKLYSWDPQYVDPKFLPSTYADINDEEVADDALSKFRGMVSEDRGKALTAMDFGAKERVKRLTSPDGLNERFLLTQEGQHCANYVFLQKLGSPATFNPTGIPQTELPGYPYLPAVGALDFIKQEEKEIAFWKSDSDTSVALYKKPAGNEMPELPYNTPASADEIKLVQEARDIIPKGE